MSAIASSLQLPRKEFVTGVDLVNGRNEPVYGIITKIESNIPEQLPTVYFHMYRNRLHGELIGTSEVWRRNTYLYVANLENKTAEIRVYDRYIPELGEVGEKQIVLNVAEKIKGIGPSLLDQIVLYSNSIGLEGRVELASLYGSALAYLHYGFEAHPEEESPERCKYFKSLQAKIKRGQPIGEAFPGDGTYMYLPQPAITRILQRLGQSPDQQTA